MNTEISEQEFQPQIELTADTVRPLSEKFSVLFSKTFDRLGTSAGLLWLFVPYLLLVIIGAVLFFSMLPDTIETYDSATDTIVFSNDDNFSIASAIGLLLILILAFVISCWRYIAISNLSDAFLLGQKPSVKETFAINGRLGNAIIAVLLQFLYYFVFSLAVGLLIGISVALRNVSQTLAVILLVIVGIVAFIVLIVSSYVLSLQPVFGVLGYQGLNSFKAAWKVAIHSFGNYGILYILIRILSGIPGINFLVVWYSDTLIATVTGDARVPEKFVDAQQY